VTADAPLVPALHTREQFSFVTQAPFEVAWPLFGAQGERAWAPDWNPEFIWPLAPVDQQGMVFKVAHGDRTAVWVNTALDRASKRIQYVYVIPDIVVTVISLRLEPTGRSTHVEVIYERTALGHSANDLVREMAQQDKVAGEAWSRQIHLYLQAHH
jgi:hypothetical protein